MKKNLEKIIIKGGLSILCLFTFVTSLLLTRQTPKKAEPRRSLSTTTKEIVKTNNDVIGEPSGVSLNVLEYDPLLHTHSELIDLPEYPAYCGNKTWENYKAITNRASKHYKLQKAATTKEYGFRMLDERYMIAIGTYFNAPVGTYVDLYLYDGPIIPCIVGDIKSDAHTDEIYHAYTVKSGCATEFIASSEIKKYCNGDVTDVARKFKNPVIAIRVYDYNYLTNGPIKKGESSDSN